VTRWTGASRQSICISLYHEATTGLTVNSLTFDSSAESASAAQAAFDYISPQGILAIGGLVSGVPLINPSDLDYRVLFDQFSTAPGFLFNLVSQLSAGNKVGL